jgi:hypothetical protein
MARPELNRPSPTRPDSARPGNPWRQSSSDHALLRGEADARRRPAAVASASAAAAAAAAVRIVAACGGRIVMFWNRFTKSLLPGF